MVCSACGGSVSESCPYHPDAEVYDGPGAAFSGAGVFVVVETTPAWLRASHIAAGCMGQYPANGAVRYVVPGAVADDLVASCPGWTEVLRVATPRDLDHYEIDLDGAAVASHW